MIDPVPAIGFAMAGASIATAIALYLSRDSSSKMWEVGDHRVEKVTTYKTVHPDGMMSKRVPSGHKYRCVDCERESDARYAMKAMPCYEVIE